MARILLINPNTSAETTAMMVGIVQAALPAQTEVCGSTAPTGVPMIVTATELQACVSQVLACWLQAPGPWSGVIVACFGDPGLDALRALTPVPVVGLCEAAMREAAQGGRHFGVATTTPDLAGAIQARAQALGLARLYTGLRATPGDATELVADATALRNALADTVAACVAQDGAQVVIVGGGPLGQVALELDGRCGVPLIAPLLSAARLVRASRIPA